MSYYIFALICILGKTIYAQPHFVTLTSGFKASAARSIFFDSIPEANTFFVSVCPASQFVPPEKLMTFLDGGDERKGILTAFQRKRTEALQAQSPCSSVSGREHEDAGTFGGGFYSRSPIARSGSLF